MQLFNNIQGVCSNFVECESLVKSNPPDILALCETNLDDSIDSGNFSVKVFFSSFNPKEFCYSYAWFCSLCEGKTSLCMGVISRKHSYLCFQMALLHSVPYFFFLYPSTSSTSNFNFHQFPLSINIKFLCNLLDAISSNIDEVLLINLSVNVFASGDFSVQHNN